MASSTTTGVAPTFDAAGYTPGATIDVSLQVTDSTENTSTDATKITVQDAQSELIYNSSDDPINIGDLKTVSSSIDVPDVVTIANLTVRINLTHANPGDLIGKLIAPDGVTEFTLNSGGPTPILSGNYEYAVPGAAGLQLDGTWTLKIEDTVKNRKRGTLYDWSLIVEPAPAAAAMSSPAAVDLALLAWVDLDSSDDDPLASQAADELALMMME